jgi:hypothetical protein
MYCGKAAIFLQENSLTAGKARLFAETVRIS